MIRSLILVILFFSFAGFGNLNLARADFVASQDEETYGKALDDIRRKNWDYPKIIAANGVNDILNRYLYWKIFTAPSSGSSFYDMTDFINRNPHWPSLAAIKKNAERTIDDSVAEKDLLDWFKVYPPITAHGRVKYAELLARRNQRDDALKLIRSAWTDGEFSYSDEKDFITRYGKHLTTQNHKDRFNRLMWSRKLTEAKGVIPLLKGNERLIAEARLALALKKKPNQALKKVPPALQTRADLLYERIRYRRQRDDYDGALELIKAREFGTGGSSEKWYNELYRSARYLMDKKHYSKAYKLIASHPFKKGIAYGDAEWFSGFIALRFLHNPAKALPHFKRFADTVSMPISSAKAQYWLGRTYEALNNAKKAQESYQKASRYTTTFYGQESLKKLKRPLPALPITKTRQSDINDLKKNELVNTLLAVEEIAREKDTKALALKVFYSFKDITRVNALVAVLQDVERYDIIVALARLARQKGHEIGQTAYPVLNHHIPTSIDETLVLGIIRQESSFETTALSSAGAHGLMQLMPSTAQRISRENKKQYLKSKLIDSPEYNIELGIRFLEKLLKKYDNHFVPVIAAYNAGETAVKRWRDKRGSPWEDGEYEETIDWIELIPYDETRNYVKRVLENKALYETILPPSKNGRKKTNIF